MIIHCYDPDDARMIRDIKKYLPFLRSFRNSHNHATISYQYIVKYSKLLGYKSLFYLLRVH
jgi:hypothetical protein